MAQRVHIILTDDLDGSDAAETVSFGLDGAVYEVDLSEDNARRLRESLQGYIGHARKVSGRVKAAAPPPAPRPTSAPGLRPRAWPSRPAGAFPLRSVGRTKPLSTERHARLVLRAVVRQGGGPERVPGRGLRLGRTRNKAGARSVV